jgi:hypothetical protein
LSKVGALDILTTNILSLDFQANFRKRLLIPNSITGMSNRPFHIFVRARSKQILHRVASSSRNMSKANAEKEIKRNPHPDFKKVESERKPWDENVGWEIKQTAKPNWKWGDGANDGREIFAQ